MAADVVLDDREQRAVFGRAEQGDAGDLVDLHGERQDVLVLAPVGRGVAVQHAGAGAGGIEDEAAAVAPVETQRREVETVDELAEAALAVPVGGEGGVARGDQARQAAAGDGRGRARNLGAHGLDDLGVVVVEGVGAAGERGRGNAPGRFRRRLRETCARCERQAFRGDVGRGRAGAGRLVLVLEAEGVADELVGVDQQVGRGAIGRGRKADRQHRGAPIPAPQLAQHRGEVGVGREHDELVVTGLVLQQVDDVEHHVDVGAGLALARQRGAVDDLEAGEVEGRAEALVGLRVEVAAPHQQPAARAGGGVVGQLERADHPVHPLQGLAGEAVGDGRVELAQAGIDVIEVDEEGAFQDVSRGWGVR